MIERIFSFIGTCIGAAIGIFQVNVPHILINVSHFTLPAECKTALMAFVGGCMAWLGGKFCSWVSVKLKARKNG